jgi:hypothetical protein
MKDASDMVIAHLRVHVRDEDGEGVSEQQQVLLAHAQRLLRQARLSDVMALAEDAADLACGVGHGLVDEVEKAFLRLGVGARLKADRDVVSDEPLACRVDLIKQLQKKP